MIKKSKRLNKESFNEVFRNGGVERSNSFLVKRLNDPKDKGLFAVSAPKKDFKSAIERNKAKRRLFSAIKDVLLKKEDVSEEKVKKHYIFIAKKGVLEIAYSKLIDEITAIIGK